MIYSVTEGGKRERDRGRDGEWEEGGRERLREGEREREGGRAGERGREGGREREVDINNLMKHPS